MLQIQHCMFPLQTVVIKYLQLSHPVVVSYLAFAARHGGQRTLESDRVHLVVQ